MENLPHQARAIRLAKKLTQQQVGHHLGMSKANYNRMEKGFIEFTPTKLEKLAVLFEMTPEAIRHYQSAETQAVAHSQQTVLDVQHELAQTVQTVTALRQELAHTMQSLQLARAGTDLARAETAALRQQLLAQQRHQELTEPLLIESNTFLQYVYELLLRAFPQQETTRVSLSDINTIWRQLVAYPAATSPEAERAYEQHQAESPLLAAKQGYFDGAVQAMRSLYSLYFHTHARQPHDPSAPLPPAPEL